MHICLGASCLSIPEHQSKQELSSPDCVISFFYKAASKRYRRRDSHKERHLCRVGAEVDDEHSEIIGAVVTARREQAAGEVSQCRASLCDERGKEGRLTRERIGRACHSLLEGHGYL